jgi:hypothetical protein
MAGIAALIPGKQFSFTKDGQFLDNHVSADITVAADGAVAAILAANQPFPAGTTKVGSLSATVGGNTGDVKFDSGQGTVSFSGSAGGSAGLAVYANPADLVADLNPDPAKPILEGLTIDGDGATQFVLLDWGYNLSGSAKGSVALGAGASANFSFDGARDGLFAVIRGFKAPPPSRDALQATVTSWKLPSQIASVEDLDPGTWLIAEVDGSVGLKIGAQYGYDYNWIRKVDLGSLSGDIGLKIQAAVDAAVGFDASGKYLVMVARESVEPASKTVRVRVFKMAMKGWDFAFNASVGVTGSTDQLLPAQLDDFIAAVFGVHGAQIVEDLKQFDKWTDPNTPLPDLFSGFVSDFVTKELGSFAGSEIQKFQEARERILDFINQWENLGHPVSTWLWSEIEKAGGPIADFMNFLKQTNALDDNGLSGLIETELGKVGFLSNPIGRWLESVTENEVLSLVDNTTLLKKVRTAAQEVLDIANGKVLDELIQFVDKKLDMAQVVNIVNEADFNNLDPWLKAKLAKFLGKDTVLFADLDKIRATAKAIRDKASQLYTETLKALNNTYTAAFHYAYSKSTTSTALVDVSFDFLEDPGVGAFMKMAIQGDFKDLLLAKSPGIALKTGTLTHGVTRQTHVQIVLPYFSDTIDHINTSLVNMNVVEDHGRLFVYDLHAQDTLIRAHKWASNLTITGKLSAGAGVRTFVTDQELADSMTFAYNFRQAGKNVRDVQLQDQLQPLVDTYFPKVFGGQEAPDTASLHEWIGDLDNVSSAVSKTGTGNLGTVLSSLDVSLPGKVVAAWFNAPNDQKADAYFQMSRNIQKAMRRFAQFCYFDDPSKYAEINAAPAIFVYGCLPISTAIKTDGASITLDLPDDVYWNFEDPNQRKAMVFAPSTKTLLVGRMLGIRQVLADSDKFKGRAGFYDPALIDSLQPDQNPRAIALNDSRFLGLLFTEAQTIRHARDAGLQIATFRSKAGNDPQAAIDALEEFGAKITDAFNKGMGGLIARIEEFSATIFLEAARAFDPSLTGVQPTAYLDVILLKPSASANAPDDFLKGTAPDPTTVALEQPVVGLP